MLLMVLCFVQFIKTQPLNPQTIDTFNAIYPRCFTQDNSRVVYVEESEDLFSLRTTVYLAPGATCSYMALGSTRLEWVVPQDPT